MRRILAMIVLVVGAAMVVLPTATGMWVRAGQGGDMINAFKPIMTQQNVNLFTEDYMPTLALGFGNVPSAMDAASQSVTHRPLSYQSASDYLASQPSLANLSYLQKNFATIAVPFTSMLAVMNSDRGAFHSLTGLPPFLLFPYFFALPGLILAACALLVLRAEARRRATGARQPQRAVRVMLVIGIFLTAAPFLPMPPGFHSIWSVAPQGGRMLTDFASPVDPGGPPIMSAATVRMFDGYLGEMKAAQAEIVPAIQGELAAQGHPVTAAQVREVIARQPALSQVSTVLSNFPAMYDKFRFFLQRMGASLGNYQAVRDLPAFPVFPYLFLIPGVIVLLASALLLRTAPAAPDMGSAGADPGSSRAEEMVARMLADRERAAPA